MTSLNIGLEELDKYNRIGIAFSGGLDSSVLLHLLANSNLSKSKLTTLHVNHGVNKQSAKWEEFCEDRSRELGINFQSWSITIPKKISEDTLREERYNSYKEWCSRDDLIITGHHFDDQVETILFRLIRGTGIFGLEGIKKFSKVKDINFYRPLLDFKKDELLQYATKHKIKWIEDDSNNNLKFSRNALRHEVFPQLKKISPSFYKSFNKISGEANKTKTILFEIAEDDYKNIGAQISGINRLELNRLSKARQENLIYFWLKEMNDLGISFAGLSRIYQSLHKKTEGTLQFPITTKDGMTDLKIILTSKEVRIITEIEAEGLPRELNLSWNLEDCLDLPTGRLSVVESYGKGINIGFRNSGAIVRARNGGERCKPFGRDKSQKIKILFQEYEIPDWKRKNVPIIYINDEIAAVGDLWVCDAYHASDNEKGLSIVWDKGF